MTDTQRLPAGFDEAFDPLFRRASLVGRRILSDPAAAEDVAAETLARAYASWRKIGDQPWREGWIVRVATNLAIDAVRRRERRGEHVFDSDRDGLDDDRDREADAVVVRLALVEAMHTLPRRQRETVALRYLAGLSEAEVADAMQVSTGSVKTHLHRGVQRLRSRLGPEVDLEVGTGVEIEGVPAHG